MWKLPGNSPVACKVCGKTGALFRASDFLRYDGHAQQGTDQDAPYCSNACVLREWASEQLLKASIDSFFVLSRTRNSLNSLKSSFHETRTVPCKCREIVATIKQVKCCKGKLPKSTKLCNPRHRQRRCRYRLVQFSFASESSARSVHIACH